MRGYSQGIWGTAVGEAKKPDKVPVLAHNFGGAVGVAFLMQHCSEIYCKAAE